MSEITKIGPIGGMGELDRPAGSSGAGSSGADFGRALADALESVDHLQKESEGSQAAFARGEPVDLHDVLIRIEQAEVAFKTMMEVRNKLVDAYREVMRMGA